MSQENFWILFAKKTAGEATPEELAELEQLIRQHPEWQYALQNIKDLWHATPQQPAIDNETEDAFLLHIQRMREQNVSYDIPGHPSTYTVSRPSRTRRLKILSWSAAAAACLAVVFYVFLNNNKSTATLAAKKETPDIHEVSTRPGSKTKIRLPDGTVVWLNAGSKLTYNKDFGVKDRSVALSGEGFFDVMKDPSRPFRITTQAIDIKVLGTVFNVRAYPEDEKAETSLLEGKIEVVIKNRPNDKIILSPNEKLVVENAPPPPREGPSVELNEPMVAINKLKHNMLDSSINEVQWKENKLVFDDEKLKDIAVKMERWFNVEIEIKEWELAERRLTGKFENESIEQALEGLAYTSTMTFKFERKGNRIIIHR